jgi:hypothetical protein
MDLDQKTYTWKDELLNWLPSIIMIPIMIYWILNRGNYTFIDNADLVIHEAGHLFFMFFGKFIYTAGGTLMQIILPSIIVFYFFRKMYKTGVQIALLWLGQNLINISVYAADARAHRLHLLGGNKVYHDWTYLLSSLGILDFDIEVGYFFFGLAIMIFILSLVLPKIMEGHTPIDFKII